MHQNSVYNSWLWLLVSGCFFMMWYFKCNWPIQFTVIFILCRPLHSSRSQAQVLIFFYNLTIKVSVKYYLILFLLCISQMNYYVEHISILLSVYFSLLSACSSLPSFFHYFYFLLLNCKWFLSMLKNNYCQIYILQIFSSTLLFAFPFS